MAANSRSSKSHPPNWVQVGQGRLGLQHRLRRENLSYLVEAGCDVVVTLLSVQEDGAKIGHHVKEAGIEWIWLKVPNGHLPQGEVHEILTAAVPLLSARLDEGKTILIHCSAGIHRTGMLTYGLLRWRGMDDEEAMRLIAQLRIHTANGLQPRQKMWADILLSERQAQANNDEIEPRP